MRVRLIRLTTLFLGLGLAGGVAAGSASDFYADRDEPHGEVVGWSKGAADDVYDARLFEINGVNLPSARKIVYLKPGEYTLKFRIVAEGHQPGPRTRITRNEPRGYNKLELMVEPGKRYYVGAKFTRGTSDFPWSIVVWKVEPQDGEESTGKQ